MPSTFCPASKSSNVEASFLSNLNLELQRDVIGNIVGFESSHLGDDMQTIVDIAEDLWDNAEVNTWTLARN